MFMAVEVALPPQWLIAWPVLELGVCVWVCKHRQTRTHTWNFTIDRGHIPHRGRSSVCRGGAGWWKWCKNANKTMTSIGGIGWSPRLGSEKSHDVHGWIVVYQKLGVLGWRIHTGCPRLEALKGRCVCV